MCIRDSHETARAAVGVLDSPKPPPVRTTLTFPRLNAAHSVWFIVSGETKAGAVARAIDGGDIDVTPAAGVHGHAETLWLVDRATATGTLLLEDYVDALAGVANHFQCFGEFRSRFGLGSPFLDVG